MKRFSDTGRFEEEWYSDLPIDLKIAWEYLWAKCDNAGVWSPNFKLADFQIGKRVAWEKVPAALGDRIHVLPSGKWLLKGFVEVQCGPQFSLESRPHQAVMASLKNHGINITDSLSIDYPRSTSRPTDKEQEKDTGEGSKGEGNGKPAAAKPDRPTQQELSAYVVELGFTDTDAEHAWNVYTENGWTRAQGGKRIPIKSWKTVMNQWKTGGWFPSQRQGAKVNGHATPKVVKLPTGSDIYGN